MINELDIVRLTADMPHLGLQEGAIGTVLMVHTAPSLAYEVEFQGMDDTVAVQPDCIQRIELNGI
jgi:hypothetical protein